MKREKQDRPEYSSFAGAITSFADLVAVEEFLVDERPRSTHSPVTTVAEFCTLDEGEVLEGYLDGVHGGPSPEPERSRSYWHGWRNGVVERDGLPPDDAMRALGRDFDRLR